MISLKIKAKSIVKGQTTLRDKFLREKEEKAFRKKVKYRKAQEEVLKKRVKKLKRLAMRGEEEGLEDETIKTMIKELLLFQINVIIN